MKPWWGQQAGQWAFRRTPGGQFCHQGYFFCPRMNFWWSLICFWIHSYWEFDWQRPLGATTCQSISLTLTCTWSGSSSSEVWTYSLLVILCFSCLICWIRTKPARPSKNAFPLRSGWGCLGREWTCNSCRIVPVDWAECRTLRYWFCSECFRCFSKVV